MNYFHSVSCWIPNAEGAPIAFAPARPKQSESATAKPRSSPTGASTAANAYVPAPTTQKIAVTEPLDEIKKFKYKIAIPAPSFVSQFSRRYAVEKVLAGFLFLGFDRVLEVGFGADLVSQAIAEYLNSSGARMPRPAISSACPAVIRLIQVRYPGSSAISSRCSRRWRSPPDTSKRQR